MCLLVLLHETAHFVKRYDHYDEPINNLEEKDLSKGGKIFFQSIFGKPEIDVITLEQAKKLLDINIWKENKTLSIFEKLGEKNEKNTISFLLTRSLGFCLHHRKKSYPNLNKD